MKSIFVGNLASNMTPDELRTLFEAYGAVAHVNIVTDSATGYSRGFAFVEMTSDEDARTAITSLNGTTLCGRTLKVEEARPRLERSQSRGAA